VIKRSNDSDPIDFYIGILMMRSYLLTIVIFFTGCSYFTSWDDQSTRAIGYSLSYMTKFDSWKNPDEVTALPDGQKEYKYHLKKIDPSCVHYWIVNEEGIITGYRYTGYCRPIG
jgi:hypothetical protein